MTDAAAPGPAEGRNETYYQLLEAARRLFREHGYDKTSLRRITQEIGVSTPAIYWHFESKQDLLFHVVRGFLTEFIANLETAAAAAPPGGRLDAMVRTYIEIQLGSSDEASAFTALYGTGQMLNRLPEGRREELRLLERQVVGMFRCAIADGVESGHFRGVKPTVTALVIISMCEQVLTWYRPDGSMGVAQIADEFSDLVGHMVGVPQD